MDNDYLRMTILDYYTWWVIQPIIRQVRTCVWGERRLIVSQASEKKRNKNDRKSGEKRGKKKPTRFKVLMSYSYIYIDLIFLLNRKKKPLSNA
jgi:hypothetical protein